MDSNMSTAAYVHRAGGSSSASSACTSSSANGNGGVGGGVVSGGGGGGRMAVIGVTRNVKLRRRGASGFGFSLRGGREYAAGFYVSDVVPGGEAHRNGLRVGDQILRVNGYPVEDAVHQEVALLAKNQQVLVLKIRSVGMIPVKDNPNDPVTWHMVQQQQQQLQYGDAVCNEIRIRILVGEKGRLGCGVCRGIVPGLTVQGTREGGPARAAGLKAGDIILWCNGQSLTDLPFERAIEVMRNAAILDLVVNRPIVNHVYDCPEALWMRGSSGYDSESSSLVGPSPPPPVHLPNPVSSPQHRPGPGGLIQQQSCNRNGRNCCPPNGSGPADWGHVEQSQEWMRKPNNTTVIRISQSHPQQQQQQQQQQYGMPPPQLQQQQFRRAPRPPMRAGTGMYEDAADCPMMLMDEEPLYDPVAPKDFECHDFDANPRDEIDRRAEYRREHGIREYEPPPPPTDDVFTKSLENGQSDVVGVVGNGGGSVVLGPPQRLQTEKERKTVTTVEVHQPCPPAPPSMPPPLPYKWPAEAKPMNAMGMQMGSTMSMGSTGSTETESSLESSCGGKDSASTSSSLSTSSSCDHHQTAATTSVQSFASSIAAAAACGASSPASSVSSVSPKIPEQPLPQLQLQLQLQPQPQLQVQQTGTLNTRPTPAAPTATTRAPGPVPAPTKIIPPPPPPIDLGTAITQELQRRAKQRSMMNNAAGQEASLQQQQQQQDKPQEARKPQNPEALRAQEQKVTHDKLMEEFKRAHQRMFSNAQQRNQSTEPNVEQTEAKRASPVKALPTPINGINKPATKTNRGNNSDDAVEMQSIESFKLKDSPSVHVPKPPPTYFPSSSSSSPSTSSNPGKQKQMGTTAPTGNCAKQNGIGPMTTTTTTTTVAPPACKPKPSATYISQTAAANGPAKAVSKVAIRIGTYNEADSKQPSRLGFLSGGQLQQQQQQQQRQQQTAEVKSSVGGSAPVASRLQNELAATLQRSNLRKKTEGENDFPSPPEEALNGSINKVAPEDCNGQPQQQPQSQQQQQQQQQSTVEKLANSLSNKVTIRVNPEATAAASR